jgi:SHS2 domain-containing protein
MPLQSPRASKAEEGPPPRSPSTASFPGSSKEDCERYADSAVERDPTLRARPFAEAFSCDDVEHTADEGFVTRASDRADLLAAATEAMGALVVDPRSVAAVRAVPVAIALDADATADERVFAWLSEALYHLDAGRLALRRAVLLEDGDSLRGVLLGEDLDESRHAMRSALKAVTWHALEVGPQPDGSWRAQVVIDV